MAKKSGIIVLFFVAVGFFALLNSPKAEAATLTHLSDTVTTSRPSAATPLNADAGTTDLSLTVLNNGSRFLASDSAKIMRTSTLANVIGSLTIASQSADLLTAFLTGATGTAAQKGTDVLITNITAMHKISFVTTTSLPSGSKIIINLPGNTVTTASPSATTFSINGLTTANSLSNISYQLIGGGGVTCSGNITTSTSGNPNSMTCTTTGGSIAGGTTVTFLIGCADSNNNEASCSTQSPRLINPTKSANAGNPDSADAWKVTVQTTTSGGTVLDQGTTSVGIIENVEVRATVDPTFSFTITGLANASALNTGNSGCTQAEAASSGIDSTAVAVNLGSLPTSSGVAPNISVQRINIATNAPNGYSLTATSSGQLMDASSGFAINSSTTPGWFPTSAPWFGIHPCGASTDVVAGTWQTGTTVRNGSGSNAKYAWPNTITPLSLASKSTGPIIGSAADGYSGIISMEYAAAVDTSVPSGNYLTTINYVATPTF